MTSDPVRLGSVHLSESDLKELEEMFHAITRDPEIEIQVKPNGFPITASTVDELTENDMVRGDSLAYDIHLKSSEGELRLVADSTLADEHFLHVNGFDEWEAFARDVVQGFMIENQNTWRSLINNDYIFFLNVIFALMLAYAFDVIAPGRVVHIAPGLLDFTLAFLGGVGLYATSRKNKVYPYFVATVGGETKYPNLVSWPILVGFAFGIIIGTLTYFLV